MERGGNQPRGLLCFTYYFLSLGRPGLGRSAGEGIGYPHQYSWTSLVAQLVKNLPATWETWVRSLGQEDPLEKGMATYPSILAGEVHGLYRPWGCKSQTQLTDLHFTSGRPQNGDGYWGCRHPSVYRYLASIYLVSAWGSFWLRGGR